MPVNIYYTQHIRGFQQVSEKYSGETAIFSLRRTQQRCPRCGSTAVVATPLRRRSIRGEPLGCCREVRLEFMVHRLYCRNCKSREMEHIHFLSHPKSRITADERQTGPCSAAGGREVGCRSAETAEGIEIRIPEE